jgi:hypothetical protein
MLSEDWIDLLAMIPENQQNSLVLTTLTGVDLNVETILRAEPSYLVFRGRVSGQTDDGRVFFLPYRQIDYLQINRQVKEAEIRRMYGDTTDPSSSASASSAFAPSLRSGAFPALTTGSLHGLSASPASPSAPAPVAGPSRPSLPGVAARLASVGNGHGMPGRQANGSDHQVNGDGDADAATPPRNSILERLRAQRNSMAPQKPLGR